MTKRTVQLLGLGPSVVECPNVIPPDTERWAIQYVWKHYTLTRAFVMDDQEWIVAKNNSFNIPIDVAQDMRGFKKPIYVAKKWPDVENTVEYPIKEILETFKAEYFMNSFAYMIALAIYEGFERIETYGLDLRYFTELGGEMKYKKNWLDETHCVAFWAGVARGRGIEFVTTKRSSVMKPVYPGDPKLYGYEVSKEIAEQRKGILDQRKKVGKERVGIFRPPKGVDPKEFLKQVSTNSVKPHAEVEAKTWENAGVVPAVPEKN